MIVTDVSIFDATAILANTTDANKVYQFMAIYFGHVMNGVKPFLFFFLFLFGPF